MVSGMSVVKPEAFQDSRFEVRAVCPTIRCISSVKSEVGEISMAATNPKLTVDLPSRLASTRGVHCHNSSKIDETRNHLLLC